MTCDREPRGLRIRDRQRGQAIVMVPVMLTALLSMGALVVDLGNLYCCYQQLLASTQAAALAGAQMLPNSTQSAISPVVQKYGVASGDTNYHPNLTSPSMTITYPSCLVTTGVPCYNSTGESGTNAIIVQQTAMVKTFFARIFGVRSLTISAKATASAAGGNNGPFDVMIVLDTTESMNSTDSDSQCSTTRINCALANIQTLVGTLAPCPSYLSSCGTVQSGNVAQPLDEVGLMAFPGLCSSTSAGITTDNCPDASTLTNTQANSTYAQYDYNCSGSNPPIASYNNDPEYLIVPLSSDYRLSAASTTLNSSSHLAIASGAGSCASTGVQAPGGEGSFLAGAITSAQAYLTADSRPNATNVIIVISDGDAGNGKMNGSVVTSTAVAPYGLYTSSNQCLQGVEAAQAAAAAGTWVYAIAYGAEASGCTTDSAPYYNNPCQAMEDIASSPSKFFSDYTATGGSSACVSAANPTTNLNQIFTKIGAQLTWARLIPNGTT